MSGPWRVARALAALAVLLVPPAAAAQRVAPPVRTLLGDVAVILRPDVDGSIAIGVAGETRAVTLKVRATDARRWADSASALLVPLRRRAQAPQGRGAAAGGTKGGRGRAGGAAATATNDSLRRARAMLEEPGVGAGSLVLTRIDSAATRSFLLFVDDAELDAIRQPLTLDEGRTLVRLMRRAAAALPTRRPRR